MTTNNVNDSAPIMQALPPFPLPLPQKGPPDGYAWPDRDFSQLSTTTAFEAGIDGRDVFLGTRRCVICGDSTSVQHAHIIPASGEANTWFDLSMRKWIPAQAKAEPRHEPRNGLLMCATHQIAFERYKFFIRYMPSTRRYIFVNYPDLIEYRHLHGKAIGLDISDRYAPFPSLFLIHEVRVPGFHPFQRPESLDVPVDSPWQDWIVNGQVYDSSTNEFKRDWQEITSSPLQAQPQPPMNAEGSRSPQAILRPLEDDAVEILAATRQSASWKACVQEGSDWKGTGEDDTQKSMVGVEVP